MKNCLQKGLFRLLKGPFDYENIFFRFHRAIFGLQLARFGSEKELVSLTRARVGVSANFAMVGAYVTPYLTQKTKRARKTR